MKRVIFFLIFFTLAFGENLSSVDNEYMNYVNKLINYEFQLKNFDKIKPPFEEAFKPKQPRKLTLVKSIKITLLAILDNKAYVRLDEFLGDRLIKTEKKWVGIGDRIGNCRVSNITFSSLYLNCHNKVVVKTLNVKIPGIKEQK
jgi:hypothetical protein